MTAKRGAAFALLLVAACTPSAGTFSTDPRAQLRILLVDRGPELSPWAVALDAEAVATRQLSTPNGARLILEYDAERSRYGLGDDAALEPAGPTDAKRHLPMPARAYRDEDGEARWDELTGAEVALEALFLAFMIVDPSPAACAREGGCYPQSSETCVTPCPQPDAPMRPSAPTPPSFGPCPAGWQSRSERATPELELELCEPFPHPVPVCTSDSMLVVGEGCVRLGACSASFAPAPSGTSVVYVDGAASAGGDGSELAPFQNVEAALSVAPGLMLASGGTYRLPAIDAGSGPITVIGGCASTTRIEAPILVRGTALTLRGVSIHSLVARDADLTLSNVIVSSTIARSLVLDHSDAGLSYVELRSGALTAEWTSTLVARALNVIGSNEGISVWNSRAVLEDIYARGNIHGVRAIGTIGTATVTLTRALIEGSALQDIDVNKSFFTARDVVLRHRGGGVDHVSAIHLETRAQFEAERMAILDLGVGPLDYFGNTLDALGGSSAQFTDLYVRGAGVPGGDEGLTIKDGGELVVVRAAITGVGRAGIYLNDHCGVVARDLWVSGTTQQPDDSPDSIGGHGLRMSSKAHARVERAQLGPVPGAGIVVAQRVGATTASTAIELEDITISSPGRDGLRVDGAAGIRAERILIRDARSNAFFGSAGRCTVSDLTIEKVNVLGATELRCATGTQCDGNGIYAFQIQLDLERFSITDPADAALELFGDADVRLAHGRVSAAGSAFAAGIRYAFPEEINERVMRTWLDHVVFESIAPIHEESVPKVEP